MCDDYSFRGAHSGEGRLLRPLWQECFGDTQEFMSCYEERMFRPERVELAFADGEPVAMLTVIPAVLSTARGESFPGGCIYGVATRTEYRGKGLATRLLSAALSRRLGQGMDCIAVVPDTPELFPYYGRAMGASTAFFVRETLVSIDQLEKSRALCPESANAADYGKVRGQSLKGRTCFLWNQEAVEFQREICRQEKGDLFLFPGTAPCCAAAERGEGGRLLVPELLAPEELLAGCLKGLMEQMNCWEAWVRLPPWSGMALGGRIEPFAMLAGLLLPAGEQAYLGFDFV